MPTPVKDDWAADTGPSETRPMIGLSADEDAARKGHFGQFEYIPDWEKRRQLREAECGGMCSL
jgi:hypothetical protein